MKHLFYSFLFLLLLSACSKTEKTITVIVTNPSDFDRNNEMVGVCKARIDSILQLKSDEQFVIVNNTGKQLPYQVLSDGKTLIFPATVKAETFSLYTLQKGTPEEFPNLVYAKFVPERKDDFAWENNRVAFRMYGPTLEATGEVSNGIDFWAKRTEKLVIDKWYADEFAGVKTYHADGGEGLDFYKVGRSLGLGAAAPYINQKIVLGNNFTDYKILENGPLRLTFKLSYAPFSIGNSEVTETRTISLDAYTQLNKIEEHFESTQHKFPAAIGLVLRDEEAKKTFESKAAGIIAYEEPENAENGIIYTGAIYPQGFSDTNISEGHLLGIADYTQDGFWYYSGAGWSKFGFASFDEWKNYLAQQQQAVANPLRIEMK